MCATHRKGVNEMQVWIVTTQRILDGEIVDMEVLDSPPRWKPTDNEHSMLTHGVFQSCRVGNVNGGDTVVHRETAIGWNNPEFHRHQAALHLRIRLKDEQLS
jgi:hypothetical protein